MDARGTQALRPPARGCVSTNLVVRAIPQVDDVRDGVVTTKRDIRRCENVVELDGTLARRGHVAPVCEQNERARRLLEGGCLSAVASALRYRRAPHERLGHLVRQDVDRDQLAAPRS